MFACLHSTKWHGRVSYEASSKKGTAPLVLLEKHGWIYYFLVIILLVCTHLRVLPHYRHSTLNKGVPIGKIELRRGTTLSSGDHLEACVGFSDRFCAPTYLTLHENGILGLYNGFYDGKKSFKDLENDLIWHSGRLKLVDLTMKTLKLQSFKAKIDKQGHLAIMRGNKVSWSLSLQSLNIHEIVSESLMIV